MAAGFGAKLVMFIVITVASMQLHYTMSQTTHMVGGALGWTIPPNASAAYTSWASQQNFIVGDTLVFNFINGAHDVAEVSAVDYDPCNSTNAISLTTTGPATLVLNKAGTHYYICTFPSHCQIGQKLTINVSASATSPPSTTPTPPTSPPTTTPPSTTPMTPTSPPATTATPPSATPTEPCPPNSSPIASPLSPPTFTSGNTTSLPPLSSGASSFASMVPATFLAIALAFLNY